MRRSMLNSRPRLGWARAGFQLLGTDRTQVCFRKLRVRRTGISVQTVSCAGTVPCLCDNFILSEYD